MSSLHPEFMPVFVWFGLVGMENNGGLGREKGREGRGKRRHVGCAKVQMDEETFKSIFQDCMNLNSCP